MHEDDSLKGALWRLLRPIPEELAAVLFVMLLTIILAVYQLSAGGRIGTETQDAIFSLNGLVRQAVDAFDGAGYAAKALLFGFWFLVGTVLYFVVWFCINLFIDLYNDIVISAAFIHPRSFHQSQYWAAITGRTVVRGLAGLGLVVYTVLAVRVIGAGYLETTKGMIKNWGPDTILLFVIATLIVGVAIHLALILYKITFFKITQTSETQ